MTDKHKIEITALCFWLPLLGKLHLENTSFWAVGSLPESLFPVPPTSTSSIEDLRLTKSRDTYPCMARLLMNIRTLKCLVLEFDLTYDDSLSAREISSSLLKHKDTLEELVLIASGDSRIPCMSLNASLNLNGGNFTRLRWLAISDYFFAPKLLEHNAVFLPRTLEEIQVQSLTTTDEFEGFTWNRAMMECLAYAKCDRLPQLKCVTRWYQPLGMRPSDRFRTLYALQTLSELFNQFGVNFEWIMVDEFEDTPLGRRLSGER